MLNDPQSVRELSEQRQSTQSVPLKKRIEQLLEDFEAGRFTGWRFEEKPTSK
jgi:hypothetical protein